jgi:16S rRNA (guanine966-N2)-methyltransferase
VVVVERARGAAFPWPAPLVALRERRYGDTVLHTARVAPPLVPDTPGPAGYRPGP